MAVHGAGRHNPHRDGAARVHAAFHFGALALLQLCFLLTASRLSISEIRQQFWVESTCSSPEQAVLGAPETATSPHGFRSTSQS